MKNKDLKKGRESIIGKIIYGFLLFIPLLAIFITCGYAMFNKNAYQSYADNSTENTYIYDSEEININTEYILQNGYKLNSNSLDGNASSNYINFNIIEILSNPNNFDFTNIDSVGFYSPSGTSISYYFKSNGTNQFSASSITNFKLKIQITYMSDNFKASLDNMSTLSTLGNDNSLSNVFYYSIDKVEQSNLFNWSKTTIIYTGIQNTCTQLGIINTFIPMLLSYWLLISVVYILYDIILMILIILHNRIHRLQDSMS